MTDRFNVKQVFGGVILKNSFIMESGPFGHSGESIVACTKAGFAAVSTETISLSDGYSPWWNIWKDGNNLYNCSKWSDITIDQWIKREIPFALANGATIIATVGHTVEDMKAIAPLLDNSGVAAIKACTYKSDQIVGMVREAKRHSKLPVWAKISANWHNYLELAQACEAEGADALVAIDSIGPVKWIRPNGTNVLGNVNSEGWMSGECVHAKALKVISDLKSTCSVPIVGVGGIMNADGVLRAEAAGASVFGLCSSILINGLSLLNTIKNDLFYIDKVKECYREDTYLDREIKHGAPIIIVDNSKCDLCGDCITCCGYMALQLGVDGRLAIDSEKCRRCGLCEQMCDRKAISVIANQLKCPIGTF